MNEQFAAIRMELTQAFTDLLASVVAALPRLVVGLLLIVAGLVVAKLLQKLVGMILTKIHFDDFLARLGLDETLERLGVSQPPSKFIPRLLYFLLLFLLARTGADALGLVAVSSAIGAFLAYVPSLLAAVVILGLGAVAARIAGGAVARAAEGAGIDYGRSLGSVVQALVLFVSGVMALGQLQIETDIVRIVTICLLAGLGLAFGLSFGLGSRDVVRNILAGFYARKVFEIGDELEIRGERGTLRSITPTQTILDSEGTTVSLANASFLDEVARRRS